QSLSISLPSSHSPSPKSSVFNLLPRPHVILKTLTPSFISPSSMADTDNFATAPVVDESVQEAPVVTGEEDEKFGFKRPEMYKENLAGSVDPYERHVFLCYKNPEAWLPRLENSEADSLPKLFASAIKKRKNDITMKTKLTICESLAGTAFEEGDILIFPDMIKYKGMSVFEVDGFVDDVLVNGIPWSFGTQEEMNGSYVFVCAHGSRDKRCGVCGPVLIEKFNDGIESRGLKDQVFVSACSHIGGHKYAGNVIVFSSEAEGKTAGHWYGYVTPEDVPEILDQHIGKGEVIERLLRGQLEVEKRGSEEKVVVANGEAEKEVGKVDEGAVNGCCQGVNGVSCCKEVVNTEEEVETNKKKSSGNVKKCMMSGGKVSEWIGSVDQSAVLAGIGVVAAVAAVAVAYSLYRRSA
ncbi:Altered inheritance of mitochondria protein 32, partial [Linum perenne]